MNLASALDDCLKRLAAGESTADVLSRYPEHAAVLAPMLAAAARCTVLPAARLTGPQRLRGKVALREALAARQARPARFAWSRAARLPLALSLALVLVMAISAAAVASSRPGDMLYSLRVAAERAPAFIMITPASRAGTELDIADRRLKDLGDHLASAGEANTVALDALLLGDETAAERALGLAAGERALLAARVAGHAEELRALAAVAVDPEADEMLRTAADRAQDIVKALRDPESGATQEGGREQRAIAAGFSGGGRFYAQRHLGARASAAADEHADSAAGHAPTAERPAARKRNARESAAGPGASPNPHAAADPDTLAHAYATRRIWTPPPTRTPRPTLTPWPTRTRPADWTPPPTRTPRPTLTPWPTRTRPAGLDAALDPHAAAGLTPWTPTADPHATAGLDATAHPPSAARLDAAGPDCCADGRWGDADRRTHGGHPAGGDIDASRHVEPLRLRRRNRWFWLATRRYAGLTNRYRHLGHSRPEEAGPADANKS